MKEINLQRKDYIDWDEFFMATAVLASKRSKDPNSQVGACIVSPANKVLSLGYNGAPIGYEDKFFPWAREGNYLETKYPFVCHAELNAILNFSGNTSDLENAKLYVTLFPCNDCAKLVIQSGIKEIIYLNDKYKDTESVKASKQMLDICGVKYKEFPQSKRKTLKLEIK